jgi:hypothetical protein
VPCHILTAGPSYHPHNQEPTSISLLFPHFPHFLLFSRPLVQFMPTTRPLPSRCRRCRSRFSQPPLRCCDATEEEDADGARVAAQGGVEGEAGEHDVEAWAVDLARCKCVTKITSNTIKQERWVWPRDRRHHRWPHTEGEICPRGK